jgi:hypothetical protein
MNKLITICFSTLLVSSILHAQDTPEVQEKRDREVSVRKAIDSFSKVETKEVSTVEKFKAMFSEGKVTGQLRMVAAGYDLQERGKSDNYAAAAGGMLKYELAELNGFNAGAAFTTSQDIDFMTGDKNHAKHNPELSSSAGAYTELTEVYVNYKNSGLNIRLGRQLLDTPLADSDDIRMVPNTFEAYVASYNVSDFTLMAGNIQSWQGADTGLDDGWVNTGERGVSFGGVSYSNTLEVSAWYYDISKEGEATNAAYLDFGVDYAFNDDLTLYASMQYLSEIEVNNSGVEADIYGVLIEGVAYGIGINIAYNQASAKDGKRSFSGIGGGTMYTSMDTMIIDEITEDRDANALVLGLVYSISDWNFLYAHGSFVGEANSLGEKAHIVEQDMGFEYDVNDEFVIAAIYVIQEDLETSAKTANDWSRAQLMVKYDF